jgi:hypothetical protein
MGVSDLVSATAFVRDVCIEKFELDKLNIFRPGETGN